MSAKSWIAAYANNTIESLGWYAASLPTSHRLARQYVPRSIASAAIIDVGAGASVFADEMMAEGCTDITLLDLSAQALEIAAHRLHHSDAITCIVDDVLTTPLLRGCGYDLWHDRAVFHFLTDPNDWKTYAQRAHAALVKDGIVVLGTFAQDGPEMCNELPVHRCGPDEIAADFGRWFDLLHTERQIHITPSGGEQAYNYFVLRKHQR